MSGPLPSGTVTFLFLDIERSTEHLQALGSDYPQLLETYRELTERAVSQHEGVIFGSEGDGLFVAFPEAGAAVLSAIEAQRAYQDVEWPRGAVVLVRMGLHTGTPTAGMAAEQEQPSLAEARRAGSEMTPHDAISFALQPHHELATAG